MFLGEIIKKYRTEHGMTTRDFAKASGLTSGYVSMLENNRSPRNPDRPIKPSLDTFGKVASAMHVRVDDLINSVDKNQPVILNFDFDFDEEFQEKLSTYLNEYEKEILRESKGMTANQLDNVIRYMKFVKEGEK